MFIVIPNVMNSKLTRFACPGEITGNAAHTLQHNLKLNQSRSELHTVYSELTEFLYEGNPATILVSPYLIDKIATYHENIR